MVLTLPSRPERLTPCDGEAVVLRRVRVQRVRRPVVGPEPRFNDEYTAGLPLRRHVGDRLREVANGGHVADSAEQADDGVGSIIQVEGPHVSLVQRDARDALPGGLQHRGRHLNTDHLKSQVGEGRQVQAGPAGNVHEAPSTGMAAPDLLSDLLRLSAVALASGLMDEVVGRRGVVVCVHVTERLSRVSATHADFTGRSRRRDEVGDEVEDVDSSMSAG